MVKTILTAMILQVPGGMVAGQSMDPPATLTDSTEAVPADSLQTSDSVQTYLAETIDDSIRIAFPSIEPDTLTEVQRLLVEFETRFLLKQLERQAAEIQAGFSFFDSLVLYYVSPRWNLRDDIDRSFYHDAGDYFKSDPGFFVLEPQVTPMRKTVQPYGLQGNRLGLLVGGQPLNGCDSSRAGRDVIWRRSLGGDLADPARRAGFDGSREQLSGGQRFVLILACAGQVQQELHRWTPG